MLFRSQISIAECGINLYDNKYIEREEPRRGHNPKGAKHKRRVTNKHECCRSNKNQAGNTTLTIKSGKRKRVLRTCTSHATNTHSQSTKCIYIRYKRMMRHPGKRSKDNKYLTYNFNISEFLRFIHACKIIVFLQDMQQTGVTTVYFALHEYKIEKL